MKKTLLLVRHAKAEDQSVMFKDFDRELVSRGIMDAARMGRYISGEEVRVDQIKTSSAARAYQTAKVIAEQLKIDVESLELVDKLYSGGVQAYLAAVNGTDESVQTLMICGHNPDISYFGEYLTRGDVGSMAKGSLITVEFEGLSWAEVSGKTGVLKNYISPKTLH